MVNVIGCEVSGGASLVTLHADDCYGQPGFGVYHL